jgi:hypothetical protein
MWIGLFAADPASVSGTTDWAQKGLTLLIGAAGGWVSGTLKVRGQQRVAVDGQVQKIIELSMEYPHLERDGYCGAWTSGGVDDDDRSRYDNYCCFVFNTLERAWELCWPWGLSRAWRHAAIGKIVHAEELICRHHRWWEGDRENLDGYSTGFREYVGWVIDKCKRSKKL